MALSVAYFFCAFLCISSVAMAAAHKEEFQLTFYGHEIRGPNGTILAAAGTGGGDLTKIGWGTFVVSDNFLKEGQSPESKTVGKQTGSAAITTIGSIPAGGLQVISRFLFTDGVYNGSSIIITGTLAYPAAPWELVVLGGTGSFRGVHGYAVSTPATVAPPLFVNAWTFYLTKH